MKTKSANPRKGSFSVMFYGGLLAIAISSITFLIPQFEVELGVIGFFFGEFLTLNMLLAGGYLAVIFFSSLIDYKWRFWKMDYRLYHIAVILASISAFSLNREESIFGEMAPWVEPVVLGSYLGLILNFFKDRLPEPLSYLTMFIAGAGVVVSGYFSVALLPTLPIAILASFLFGISLHLLTPLASLEAFVRVFRKNPSRPLRLTFAAGFLIPVVYLGLFSARWVGFQNDVKHAKSALENTVSDVPEWVSVTQRLKDSPYLEQFIGSGNLWNSTGAMRFLDGRSGGFDNRYDPRFSFVMGVFGNSGLPVQGRNEIGMYLEQTRHQSQRRLWSGQGLFTANVTTNVELFPEFRMVYTEKYIDIGREKTGDKWDDDRPREAVYTFYLPEGSVASSLSLWVNGVESMSRLTTKAKADSAYRNIVGVERRDPALVHWQEGNTLVVTVFPCNIGEHRRFKLGITSPLKVVNDQLVLEAIRFDGPPDDDADEKFHLEFKGEVPGNLGFPSELALKAPGEYEAKWPHNHDLHLTMGIPQLSNEAFRFNGWDYRVAPLNQEFREFSPGKLYLDVDKSWSKADFNSLVDWAQQAKIPVFVFNVDMKEVTPENRNQLYSELSQFNFNLFPFYLITNPENSLVVTHSATLCPGLEALKKMEFGRKLGEWIAAENPVKVYHFGEQISPYLKGMREIRGIEYARGNFQGLLENLNTGTFPVIDETDQQVAVHEAGIYLRRDSLPDEHGGSAATSAPDHLLRLYAYNDILRLSGPGLLTNAPVTAELLRRAEEAYIVTPISSLVVLETEGDYDRFGIQENEGTIGNAKTAHGGKSLGSLFSGDGGAVPEPHEWALIIMTILAASWLFYRKKMALRS